MKTSKTKNITSSFGNYLAYYLRVTLFIIPLVIAIISITLYIGEKPDREQVKEMISDSVHYRIDRLETQLDAIQKDIKRILQNNTSFMKGQYYED